MIPDTFAPIERLGAECRRRGIEMLVEIHGYHRSQMEIAEKVDWVYDFALPPLVLDALYTAEATVLRHWLEIRPTNAVTVLDTHDGIGVVDVGHDQTDPGRPGLLDPARLGALVEEIHRRSGGSSRQATGAAANNLDLYQVNCTFADAIADDNRYLLARLIQMLVPGVPQVYYVGALAGGNDVELLERTGVGRDINRHHYSPEEIVTRCRTPGGATALDPAAVVEGHGSAIRRKFLPQGRGRQRADSRWRAGDVGVAARIDLAEATFELELIDRSGRRTITDLVDLEPKHS